MGGGISVPISGLIGFLPSLSASHLSQSPSAAGEVLRLDKNTPLLKDGKSRSPGIDFAIVTENNKAHLSIQSDDYELKFS